MDDPIMNIILASVQIACMIIGSEWLQGENMEL